MIEAHRIKSIFRPRAAQSRRLRKGSVPKETEA